MATSNKTTAEGYPALKRLGFPTGKRAVPFVQQLEWTDCGAASLCMVMAYYGRETKLPEVRDAMGIGRDGVSAKSILDTAERYGLTGRGIKVDISQIRLVKTGTILHWEFNHFVVFDRIVKDGVRIVDPATGPRDVPMHQFGKAFTGVAIELIPTDRFTKIKREKGRLTRYVQELMSERGLFSRIIIVSMALKLIGLVMPLITGMIIDRVVPRADYDLLYVCLASIGGMTTFTLISDIVRMHLLLHLQIALETRMTLGFLDHMTSLPYAFFQRRSTGDLMMRVDSNSTVRETVTSKSMSAVIDGVFVLLYAVIIFYVNPMLGVITIAMSAAEALVFVCARPTYHRLLAANLDKQAKTHSYMVQMLGGMETLKCAGAERLGVEKWSNLYTDELNVKMRRARVTAYVDGIRGAVASLGPLLILTIGGMAAGVGSVIVKGATFSGVVIGPRHVLTAAHVIAGGLAEDIPARTVLWAAGVSASSFARTVAAATGAATDRAGRVIVGPDLTIPGHPEIFVVGDAAVEPWHDGHPVPGVAQGAIQGGSYAAAVIRRRVLGRPYEPFAYTDKGDVAVIGRLIVGESGRGVSPVVFQRNVAVRRIRRGAIRDFGIVRIKNSEIENIARELN
jgi:hypothetical protein